MMAVLSAKPYLALIGRPIGSWQTAALNVPPRLSVSIVEKPSPPSETGMISASPSVKASRAASPASIDVRHPLNESMAMSAFIDYVVFFQEYANDDPTSELILR